MAKPVKFESSWEKEKYKEIRRKEREVILAEAKAEYDRKEKRKERARQQGEGTWMLPSVDSRIQYEEQEMAKTVSSDKHKKKKKKKHTKSSKPEKKSKKNKQRSRASSQSDSSHSSSEEKDVWQVKNTDSIERQSSSGTAAVESTRTIGPKLERDSWMTTSTAERDIFAGFGLNEQRKNAKAEAMKAQADALEEQRLKRELNPYWKNGGTGMPTELVDHNPPAPIVLKSSASDGGLSWWRKAYQRCCELAESEGRDLEEIAAERYGSLAELKSKLEQAEAANKGARSQTSGSSSMKSFRFQRPDDGARSGTSRSTNSGRDDRQGSLRFRRPGDDDDRDNCSQDKRSVETDSHSRFKRPGENDDEDYRSRDRRSDDRFGRDDHHRGSRSKDLQRPVPAWKKKDAPSNTSRLASQILKRDHSHSGSDSESRRSMNVRREEKASVSNAKSRDNSSRHKRTPSVSSSSSDTSDSESSSESGEEPVKQQAATKVEVVIKPLSEQEMNQLGAKILKAELMGNEKLAQELKNQLEAARLVSAEKPRPVNQKADEEEVVVLSRTDGRGIVRPVLDRKHPVEPERGRRKKQKVTTHGKKGERERYFDDDDSISLKTMVEREKLGTAEDQNHMFARLAGRGIDRTDDEYQMDDALLSKAAVKQSQSHIESRDRQLAMIEHKKMSSSLDKCQFCFSNIPKHLIVAIGIKVCLTVPNHRSMDDGHCLIVPMQHVTQSTAIDEDVWDEIKIFRKGLTRMFDDSDQDCVFMETAMGLNRFPHMFIECVPLPKHVGDTAPIYFKKAIQECESEWSDNKKLVDLSKKDIRKSVPKGFPYFSVDFGLQGGYAHVIEDEKSFPSYFGREVVGGMLDLEPTLWRKPHQERFDSQRKKVLKFAEMWKPYDWTQRLKHGSGEADEVDDKSTDRSTTQTDTTQSLVTKDADMDTS